MAGFLALTGMPPFGLFLSKFTILKAAFDGGRSWVAIGLLGFLAIIFVGMTTAFLAMAQGEPEKTINRGEERWWQIAPPAVLGCLVLGLGLTVPDRLMTVLHQVAATLGGAQ